MLKKFAAFSAITGAAMMTFVACGTQPISYDSLESQLSQPTGLVNASTMSSVLKQFQSQAKFGTVMGGSVDVDAPTGTNDVQGMPQPLTANLTSSTSPLKAMKLTRVPTAAIKLLRPDVLGLRLPAKTRVMKKNAPADTVAPQNKVNPLSCIDGDNIAKKDANYSMSLSCLGSGTGTIHIETRGVSLLDMNETKTEIDGEIKVHFDQACNEGVCLNGRLAVKMNIANTSSKVLTAYNLQMTENGKEAASLKGGMRIANSRDGEASFEMLVFFKNEDGREVSVAIGGKSTPGNGSGGVYIKGKNGSFVCMSENNGQSGKCQIEGKNGEGAFSWKAN
jgi:hypothetical protein